MTAIKDHRKALFQCMSLLRWLQREAEAGSPVRVPAWGDVREYDALALEALWEGLDKLDTDLENIDGKYLVWDPDQGRWASQV